MASASVGSHGPSSKRTFRPALLSSLPGRLLTLGIIIKLVVFVLGAVGLAESGLVQATSTIGSIALAIGLGYFLYQLILTAKHRLLWRVRRKLILSYIFIGVVPALLIVAFFVLCGLLLFFNVSSYLVKGSLRNVTDEATFLARSTALEIQQANDPGATTTIIQRRYVSAATRFPGVSFVFVPASSEPCEARGPGRSARPPSSASSPGAPTAGRAIVASPIAPIRAGPWAHLDPPPTLPAWVSCDGFGGIIAYVSRTDVAADRAADEDTRLAIRGAGVPPDRMPTYAVIVDIPVNDTIIERLRNETSIEVGRIGLAGVDNAPRQTSERPAGSQTGVTPPPAGGDSRYRFPWVTLLDYVDWETGEPNRLTMSIGVDIAAIYDQLSGSQARLGTRSFGDYLFYFLLLVAALFLIIEIAALIMGLALARSITGSIHELFTGTERVRQGDFTHRIGVRVHDQLGELAGSFNTMTGSIEDLLVQSAEKKRLEEEMRLAREIQMSLLPQGPLSIEGLTIVAMCVPAREVGGDYYDVFPLDDGRLGILIADVSGKGVSAALYMAELKGLMLSLSQMHRSPRALLIDANRVISNHLDSRSFITMTYAIVDVGAGIMTYARAGHTPLIHLQSESGRAEVLAPDGLVLGLRIDDGGVKFTRLLQEAMLPLGRGDVLMFFTDGLSEAMNEASDCFGEARLGRLIEEHAHRPFEELRERILREIDVFVGAAPQHDDMTMILLKVEDKARRQESGVVTGQNIESRMRGVTPLVGAAAGRPPSVS